MNARAERIMRDVRKWLHTATEMDASGNRELALVAEAIAATKLAIAIRLSAPTTEEV